jgi:hypothetical protein
LCQPSRFATLLDAKNNQEMSMSQAVGWIGLGRMGEAMAKKLIKAGHDVRVWNRTASKAAPLAEAGATIVATKQDLAGCAVVFTMVSTTDDLKEVLFAAGGLLTGSVKPRMVIGVPACITEVEKRAVRESAEQAVVTHEPSRQVIFGSSYFCAEFHFWGHTHDQMLGTIDDLMRFLFWLGQTHTIYTYSYGACMHVWAKRRENNVVEPFLALT